MNKRRVFTSVFMAFCMSFCMSLVMSIVNVGFVDYFLQAWLRSWSIGFIVALPLSFLLPSAIQKLATKLGIGDAGPKGPRP